MISVNQGIGTSVPEKVEKGAGRHMFLTKVWGALNVGLFKWG